MNYSMRHCALAISALLVSVSAIGLNTPAQARPIRQRHDNLQAQNLAYAALTQCYTYNNSDGCGRLTRIKSVLATWCEQNDRDSCTVYRNVVGFEGLKQSERTNEILRKAAAGAG